MIFFRPNERNLGYDIRIRTGSRKIDRHQPDHATFRSIPIVTAVTVKQNQQKVTYVLRYSAYGNR